MKEYAFYTVVLILLVLNLVQYNNHQKIILEYHTKEKAQIGDILVLEAIEDNGTIHIVPQDQSNEITSHVPQLIWNADDEGIPAVGGLIKVEMIEKDKYYLIPVEDGDK